MNGRVDGRNEDHLMLLKLGTFVKCSRMNRNVICRNSFVRCTEESCLIYEKNALYFKKARHIIFSSAINTLIRCLRTFKFTWSSLSR